jgi:hypothetical protein
VETIDNAALSELENGDWIPPRLGRAKPSVPTRAVIPGRASSREPGIQSGDAAIVRAWIPGSPHTRRPGMTGCSLRSNGVGGLPHDIQARLTHNTNLTVHDIAREERVTAYHHHRRKDG